VLLSFYFSCIYFLFHYFWRTFLFSGSSINYSSLQFLIIQWYSALQLVSNLSFQYLLYFLLLIYLLQLILDIWVDVSLRNTMPMIWLTKWTTLHRKLPHKYALDGYNRETVDRVWLQTSCKDSLNSTFKFIRFSK
jgi:hypothetical protein